MIDRVGFNNDDINNGLRYADSSSGRLLKTFLRLNVIDFLADLSEKILLLSSVPVGCRQVPFSRNFYAMLNEAMTLNQTERHCLHSVTFLEEAIICGDLRSTHAHFILI